MPSLICISCISFLSMWTLYTRKIRNVTRPDKFCAIFNYLFSTVFIVIFLTFHPFYTPLFPGDPSHLSAYRLPRPHPAEPSHPAAAPVFRSPLQTAAPLISSSDGFVFSITVFAELITSRKAAVSALSYENPLPLKSAQASDNAFSGAVLSVLSRHFYSHPIPALLFFHSAYPHCLYFLLSDQFFKHPIGTIYTPSLRR